jgi:transcriptional regulator with XRE-family HTH domain
MEVFEVINKVLNEMHMTKREFAQRLIALEPKSNRTGEILSENIIYSYLNGKTAIKAYLIPYISDVLGIPEQFLFEETPKTRKKLLQYLLETLTKDELDYLSSYIDKSASLPIGLADLLQYAPPPLLIKIEDSLKKIKNITHEF